MLGVGEYFWRLIPANPILLRVVETGGKRKRDLAIRCAYLGLLVFFVILLLLTSGGSGNASSLDVLAQTSGRIFQRMSYLQLALVALLAPIFTAGAITQEKDSQTYDILLATPLTNGQIVLGSLLSRLFFVIALLLSGIPIFSITQIFGGVSIASIAKSFGIAAATAFVTGALAMAIAVLKVGTRRTIFSFYLFVVLYLVGLYLLDQVKYFQLPGRGLDKNAQSHISWFTGLHPFLALRTIFNDPAYVPPVVGQLPENLRAWPLRWYFTQPASFFTTFMFVLSFVLIAPSIVVLRRIAQSTTSMKTLILQKLKIVSGDRTRKPRTVWANPIAWREAKTKASAARATVLRYGFMLFGVGGAIVLLVRYHTPVPAATVISPFSFDSKYNVLTITKAGSPEYLKVTPFSKIDLEISDPAGGQRSATGSKPMQPFSLSQMHGPLEVIDYTGTKGKDATLTMLKLRPIERQLPASTVRQFLLGAAIVEFAVILLIVTNAAASTVTREKEDGTLDILLATPITSRYYVWGKLRGLVYFVLPLIAVPVVSALLFILGDILTNRFDLSDPNFQWIVFPEAIIILPLMLIIVAAFAAILGMQMSLRCRKTVVAVMSSVGIVVGACAVLGFCGHNVISDASNSMSMAVAAFSPFTAMTVLIDPYTFASRLFGGAGRYDGDPEGARTVLLIFSLIAVGSYAGVVGWMYKSMVKNFDMTIRRQSR